MDSQWSPCQSRQKICQKGRLDIYTVFAVMCDVTVYHHDTSLGIEDIGLFDNRLPACEDYEIVLRITANYPVLLIEEPQIKKHGGHEDQLSQKLWGMDRFRINALQKSLDSGQLSNENRQAQYPCC